jgi:hypothetical protein
MQALAERLEERVGGAVLAAVQPIGFSGLKTFDPHRRRSSAGRSWAPGAGAHT